MLFRLAVMYLGAQVLTRISVMLANQGVPAVARYSLFGACGFLCLVVCMWIWQEKILYIPSVPDPSNPMGGTMRRPAEGPAGLRSPSERGMPSEDVKLVASDGVTSAAWFIEWGRGLSVWQLFFSSNLLRTAEALTTVPTASSPFNGW